eukprot:TRINITY_DN3778_c0_g1_i3.p2 TRINITY_DN3778_c0_g1~~TRINITY_DN3778_c0_g1_i3.p2  ORF type:complete len:159 (+),score=33.31 TRINITY_DN3778_c0_g1_i3:1556-2032(+)
MAPGEYTAMAMRSEERREMADREVEDANVKCSFDSVTSMAMPHPPHGVRAYSPASTYSAYSATTSSSSSSGGPHGAEAEEAEVRRLREELELLWVRRELEELHGAAQHSDRARSRQRSDSAPISGTLLGREAMLACPVCRGMFASEQLGQHVFSYHVR